MAIARDGYVFVPRCVDGTTLQALRAEADSLFGLKRDSNEDSITLTENEYFDKGCALDFFTTLAMKEDDKARVAMDEYMARRNGRRRPRAIASSAASTTHSIRGIVTTMTTPSSAPKEAHAASSASNESADPPSDKKTPQDTDSRSRSYRGELATTTAPHWTDQHVSIVQNAIFGTLAGFARDALEEAPSAVVVEETRAAGAYEGRLLLFNEQYVVKPPQSSIEFGWHTDEREQLAMCVLAPGAQPPVYVSVWLALDDCDAVNGCLEIYPQAWNQKRLQAPTDEDVADVVCLPAKAGAAVVFLSNVWHRSGPNRTEKPRRVFYAQYSLDVIRAAPSDPRPLSLAVPCMLRPRSPVVVVAPAVTSPPGVASPPGFEPDRCAVNRGSDDGRPPTSPFSRGDDEEEKLPGPCGGEDDVRRASTAR